MFKSLFLLTACLGFSIAHAEPVQMTADLSKIPAEDRPLIEEMCVTTLNIDPAGNVALQVAHQMVGIMTSVKQIESSKGSISGGGGLQGDYLTRVYIVKSDVGSAYPMGVYQNVTVTQFGKRGSNELKGLEVEVELLNYRNSAELAEGQICNRLTFK